MGFFDRVRAALTNRHHAAPASTSTAPPTGWVSPEAITGQHSPAAGTAGPGEAGSSFVHNGPRFAVVDVETTGLSPTSHRILEIAVVTTDTTGRIVDAWSTRLNPQGPVGATHIHGITDADVAGAPLFADIVDHLNARLVGAAICAHNARFDLAFLRAEYARAGWRMPFLPALCTLEASSHYLPDLPRRRLVDVCHAIGHPPHRAHSALDDAHATAALLAAFMHPSRPPRTADLDLPARGHTVTWPTSGARGPVPIAPGPAGSRRMSGQARRVMAAAAAAPPPKPLVQLIGRFSLLDALHEGAPAGTVPYLEKLAEALEDGILTPAEASDLGEVADTYDLCADDVAAAHRAFVFALAHEAIADGKITRSERAELTGVADALGVGASVVRRLLKDAEARHHDRLGADLRPLPEGWPHGEPLRVGDRVVFTGCNAEVRSRLEAESIEAGVRVMNGVAATTALLVTDGSMDGTKAAKARELGTRTVTPEIYRVLFDHLQPRREATNGGPPAAATNPARSSATPAPAASTSTQDGFPGPSVADIRAWGRANGWAVGDRGRLPAGLAQAYEESRDTAPAGANHHR